MCYHNCLGVESLQNDTSAHEQLIHLVLNHILTVPTELYTKLENQLSRILLCNVFFNSITAEYIISSLLNI